MKKLILLFLFTFLVYSNSFHIPFYFDDQHMILKNPFIKSFKFIPFFFKGFVTGYNFPQGMCRPLLMITFSLNYFFGRLSPAGYHLINLIFHILSGALLFFILKFLFKKSNNVLFLITLLFLLHPLNTETVNYISSRSDLMVSFFILLAFLFYLKERYFLSVIFYIFSLFSKETGLCFSLFIFSYEFSFYFKNLRQYIKERKKIIYFFSLLILIACLYLLYRQLFFVPLYPIHSPRGFYSNFLIQAAVTFLYLKLFLFPYPLNLVRDFPQINSLLHPLVLPSFIGFLFLIILIFIFKKRKPLISFSILWYLCGLLPKFYARLYYPAMEHHFYLPSFGIYIILAYLFLKIYPKFRRKFSIVFTGIIVLFGVLTYLRNEEWANPVIFWKKSLERGGLKGVCWHDLGVTYAKMGNFKEAEHCFKKSLEVAILKKNKRSQNLVKNSLALLYFRKKDYENAERLAREVVKSRFLYASSYYILSEALWRKGEREKAIKVLETLKKKLPFFWRTYEVLAQFYLKNNNLKNAELNLEKAIEYNHLNWKNYTLLGKILEKKNLGKAINLYKKAISLNKYDYYTHFLLGLAYAKKREYLLAKKELEETIKLNPKYAPAYYNLSIIYAIFHKKEAEKFLKKAEELGYKVPSSLKKEIYEE